MRYYKVKILSPAAWLCGLQESVIEGRVGHRRGVEKILLAKIMLLASRGKPSDWCGGVSGHCLYSSDYYRTGTASSFWILVSIRFPTITRCILIPSRSQPFVTVPGPNLQTLGVSAIILESKIPTEHQTARLPSRIDSHAIKHSPNEHELDKVRHQVVLNHATPIIQWQNLYTTKA